MPGHRDMDVSPGRGSSQRLGFADPPVSPTRDTASTTSCRRSGRSMVLALATGPWPFSQRVSIPKMRLATLHRPRRSRSALVPIESALPLLTMPLATLPARVPRSAIDVRPLRLVGTGADRPVHPQRAFGAHLRASSIRRPLKLICTPIWGGALI